MSQLFGGVIFLTNKILQKSNDGVRSIVQKKSNEKQTIFWDIDDVVLNTNEAMVEYLNTYYRIPNNLPPKTQKDCKDWGYHSIKKDLSEKEREKIFDSLEFWLLMEMKPEFVGLLKSGVLDGYNNCFVTKGNKENIKRKLEFLLNFQIQNYIKRFEYYGLELSESKSLIDMKDGIMIDDNFYNFEGVNAGLKILVKNGIETEYNNSFQPIQTMDNLYVVDNVSQIKEILKFCTERNLVL